jgi:hypothetical protein
MRLEPNGVVSAGVNAGARSDAVYQTLAVLTGYRVLLEEDGLAVWLKTAARVANPHRCK